MQVLRRHPVVPTFCKEGLHNMKNQKCAAGWQGPLLLLCFRLGDMAKQTFSQFTMSQVFRFSEAELQKTSILE